MSQAMSLPWLEPGDPFPSVDRAWGAKDPAPGLLAAGGALDVPTLQRAYRIGVFPWFSEGQPILWWNTHPRMVLRTSQLRLHRSLRKTLRQLLRERRLSIRVDHDFERVIGECARVSRHGQNGTWILPEMVRAYVALHRAGSAHSVETWIDGQLAGGLYCVNLGSMVFGESMFSLRSDASKMALCALVAFCRDKHIELIDCQQDTAHLASMGAELMPRSAFSQHLQRTVSARAPDWHFDPVYWNHLFPEPDARV